MRVPLFLAEQQVAFERLSHPPAYSAQRRAHYLHVPGGQLVKGVLLRGLHGHFLAVLLATARVDLDRLAQALGGPVRLANRDEIPVFFRDCEWGGVTAFGSLYGLPTVLEESLDPESWIVFEGHSHAEAIRMRCHDFERLERPQRLSFAM
ncbi:MAG: YbaK/EbsC family protein [Gemmataceae bacterium]|nr:YbaK/EbsC family protein [Gemmataceae bacterium]